MTDRCEGKGRQALLAWCLYAAARVRIEADSTHLRWSGVMYKSSSRNLPSGSGLRSSSFFFGGLAPRFSASFSSMYLSLGARAWGGAVRARSGQVKPKERGWVVWRRSKSARGAHVGVLRRFHNVLCVEGVPELALAVAIVVSVSLLPDTERRNNRHQMSDNSSRAP